VFVGGRIEKKTKQQNIIRHECCDVNVSTYCTPVPCMFSVTERLEF